MKRPKRPKYVPGLDGLPSRSVGPWVGRKVHFTDRFTQMFATGMKNRWPRRSYIELFAGPGQSFDHARGLHLEGSAMRAMRAQFTDYFFVDIDPVATGALRQRARGMVLPNAPLIVTADCNRAIDTIVKAIPPGIAMTFIDPTNWQVRFETVAQLAAVRRMDLLFTFHVGGLKRVARLNMPAVDAFFPPGSDWHAALRRPRAEQVQALIDLYLDGLAPFGYHKEGVDWIPVKNSTGATIYVLVVFSKHPLGLKFWREAMDVDEHGQMSLWERGARPRSAHQASDPQPSVSGRPPA
jgi:three-Cys-motif partner protein